MRKRDWAGTVVVGCLTTAAALLHDHTLLLVLLLSVVLVCLGVIFWDIRQSHNVAGHAVSSPPSWKRDVIRQLQDDASRAQGEPPQDRARREARELADVLAELHAEGRSLRERVKPENAPVYLLALQTFRFPNVPAHEQTSARQWDGKVRSELAAHAARFVPEWEGIAGLPPSNGGFAVPMITADGRRIVAFLDAKLALLLRLIAELRDGK
jgi:hypothetical protein